MGRYLAESRGFIRRDGWKPLEKLYESCVSVHVLYINYLLTKCGRGDNGIVTIIIILLVTMALQNT